MKKVTIYTDGGCIRNPKGPGGYGIVMLYSNNGEIHKKEIYGGYNNTTNNRMELMAVIVGLEKLKERCSVEIYTDSQYIVNAVNKGWANNWKNNNWHKGKNSKSKAKNSDLWDKILKLIDKHQVKFIWVKGHAGNYYNECCDRLANIAMKEKNLPDDLGDES
ncbi:MAG: ribonuclease HI [Clostridiales bacterium]